MTLIQAVILGIVQGITEFFPISSSGHLVILQSLFGLHEPQLTFDIFLHLGTLASIIIFFHRDIIDLFQKDRAMIAPLLLASIPTFIIGFLFKDTIERYFAMPRATGSMLLVTGVWLLVAQAYSKYRKSSPKLKQPARVPRVRSAVLVGIAQGLAIMPGISRSGATIATGMLSGLDKISAFRFSFLLAIPAIAGASLLKAGHIVVHLTTREAMQFAVGAFTAMAVGIVAIKFLLSIIKRGRLYIFGIYCFLLGILIIILT